MCFIRIVAAALLFSAVGCSVITNLSPPSPPTVVVQSPTRRAAAVILEQRGCPVTGTPPTALRPQFAPLAGLAAAGISALANTAWTAIQNYIQESKNNLTATYVADGVGSLPNSDCLVIVNGTFGPVQTTMASEGALTRDNLTRLGLAKYPKLYMEAWITQLGSGRILIAPSLLQFAATEAKNPGDGVKSISIILTVSDQPQQPAAAPPAAAAAAAAPDRAGSATVLPGNGAVHGGAPAPSPTQPSLGTVAVPFEFRDVKWGTFTREAASPTQRLFLDQRRVASVSSTETVNLHAIITETANPDLLTNTMIATLPQSANTIDDALKTAIQNTLASTPAGKAAR